MLVYGERVYAQGTKEKFLRWRKLRLLPDLWSGWQKNELLVNTQKATACDVRRAIELSVLRVFMEEW